MDEPEQLVQPIEPPKPKSKWPIIISGFILFIVVGIAGFAAGRLYSNPIPSDNPTISDSFPNSPSPSKCPMEYEFFENDFLSVCYPQDMTTSTQYYTSTDVPPRPAVVTTFENDAEKIVITTSFTGGWGGGGCLSDSKQTVSDYPADLLIWDEDGHEPCGNIINMVSLIGGTLERTGNLPVAIDYQQKGNSVLNQLKLKEVLKTLRIK